jgi:glycosyltransferase involved in cell wall biosynthesis
MRMPLVSIVIPAYNGGRYLRESVQSVLTQDYPHIELLVLDDGSADNTREILQSYANQFYWESQANTGQASTLNKGWRKAKGEILSYLSVDDTLEPHAVRVAVDHLVRYPEVVLVYGDFNLMDAKNNTLRHVRAPDFHYVDMVANFVCQPGPGVFFRRDAFEAVGGWNSSLRQVPDYEYWLRLGLRGTFLHIPQTLARFRVHAHSLSYAERSVERAEECVRVMREYFQRDDLPAEVRAVERQAYANAHLNAARAHLCAGRYQHMATQLRQAWHWRARSVLSGRACRLLGNGLRLRLRRCLRRRSV